MKTYIVQPGHVLTQTGGELVYAGGEIELADQEAAAMAHAVTLKPLESATHTKPSPDRK
jgi:hypothetical protein